MTLSPAIPWGAVQQTFKRGPKWLWPAVYAQTRAMFKGRPCLCPVGLQKRVLRSHPPGRSGEKTAPHHGNFLQSWSLEKYGQNSSDGYFLAHHDLNGLLTFLVKRKRGMLTFLPPAALASGGSGRAAAEKQTWVRVRPWKALAGRRLSF